MKVSLLCFSTMGEKTKDSIQKALPFEFSVYERDMVDAKDFVKTAFFESDALVFVGAVGIAVRLCAGHIRSKDTDPAVVVVDEQAQYVIPMLSGHLGGANALARRLASALDAKAVITTSTDTNGVFAVDDWCRENNCVIADTAMIKQVSSALLRNETVGLQSDFPIDGELPTGLVQGTQSRIGVCVSLDAAKKPFDKTLNVIPKIVTVGAGCRKGTDSADFDSMVRAVFAKQDISVKAIKTLASIEQKAGERCMVEFAEKNRIPFMVYSAAELGALTGEYGSSPFVEREMGVGNVCERSAMAAANDGELILKKKAMDGMTIAAAAQNWRCVF